MTSNNDYLLSDHQPSHSEFQLRNFVVGKEVTLFGQYKQALREVSARTSVLKQNAYAREYLLLDIEATQKKLKKRFLGAVRKKRLTLELMQKQDALHNLDEQNAETQRELTILTDIAETLKEKIGDLSPERRKELEAKHWEHKARMLIVLDTFAYGRLNKPTLEFVASLPQEIRKSIFGDFPGAETIEKQLEPLLIE